MVVVFVFALARERLVLVGRTKLSEVHGAKLKLTGAYNPFAIPWNEMRETLITARGMWSVVIFVQLFVERLLLLVIDSCLLRLFGHCHGPKVGRRPKENDGPRHQMSMVRILESSKRRNRYSSPHQIIYIEPHDDSHLGYAPQSKGPLERTGKRGEAQQGKRELIEPIEATVFGSCQTTHPAMTAAVVNTDPRPLQSCVSRRRNTWPKS